MKVIVTIYLHNGKQVEAHFDPTHTLADLCRFVDIVSGLTFRDQYRLLQIFPNQRSLENLQETLHTSTVVQTTDDNRILTTRAIEEPTDVPSASSTRETKTPRPPKDPKVYKLSKSPPPSNDRPPLLRGPYSEQIVMAFMFTAANLLGVALLTLLYYNLVMFWPYINPFFWAVIVGLVLRTPRDKIVKCLAPLEQVEVEYKARKSSFLPFSMITKYFKKLRILCYTSTEILSSSNVYYMGGAILVAICGYLFLSTTLLGSWQLVVTSICLGLLVILPFLIIPSPSTFAAFLLLTSLLLSVGALSVFSTIQLVREGGILVRLLEPTLHSLSQLTPEKALELVGIAGEGYEGVASSVLVSLHDTIISKLNYTSTFLNITEIGTISSFSDISNIPSSLSNLSSLSNITNLEDLTNFSVGEWGNVMDLINSNWAVTTKNVVFQVGSFLSKWMFGGTLFILNVFAWFSSSFYNLIISIVVFLTSLFLMLTSETDYIESMVRMFPGGASTDARITHQIRDAVTRVFLSTFVVCGVDAVCTYLVVAWVVEFKLPFMYSFACALLTLFPLVSPLYVLHIPLVAFLCLRGRYTIGVAAAACFLGLMKLDAWLCDTLIPPSSSSSVTPHSWVSGLSAVMGLYAFGSQGILLGPLLVYLTIILYKVFADALRDPRKRETSLLQLYNWSVQ